MRQAEKLQNAHDQFLICANKVCPIIIKTDCIQWLSEVTSAIPSLTVRAEGRSGQNMIDVRVSIDGKQAATTLDGNELSVDPGVHTVRVETVGEEPKEQRVVVSVGEKARKIAFRFGNEPAPEKTIIQRQDRREPATSEGHTILPWIVTGAGVVAVGVGLTLALTVSNQDTHIPTSCNANLTCSVAGDGQKASDASAAEARQRNGYIGAVVGAALVAGGLVWHFLERSAPKDPTTELRITPTLGFNYAGVRGSF